MSGACRDAREEVIHPVRPEKLELLSQQGGPKMSTKMNTLWEEEFVEALYGGVAGTNCQRERRLKEAARKGVDDRAEWNGCGR